MSRVRSHSISRRVAFGLSAIIIASTSILIGVRSIVLLRDADPALRRETAQAADQLAKALEQPVWELDMEAAQKLGERSTSDPRVVAITIEANNAGSPRFIRVKPTADTVLASREITHNGRPIGSVSVALDRGPSREQLWRSVTAPVAVAVLALVAVLIGVRVMLWRLLERPLDEMSQLANRYSAGDYADDGKRLGYGELRDFSQALRGMGHQISRQLGELRETNERLAAEVAVRREAEAAVRLQSAAMQAAANAILISDRDGKVLWVNEAFTALTLYPLVECVGLTPGALLNSGRQDLAFNRRLWQTINGGHVFRSEIINRRKDGTLFTAETTITPLHDDAGVITHFIAVQQDITQRKLLEEQFRQAQKMDSVGRLAAGVAHDFNNTLSVIRGYAEIAMQELDPQSPMYEDVGEIYKAAQRSTDLTRQLLTFARKQDVAPRVVDLNAAVSESLKMLQRLIGEGVALVWRPATAPCPVLMDPSQLDQLLANLCVNARDAIEDVGTLTLTTESVTLDETTVRAGALVGDYVRLTVSDSGCGMSPELLSQIFEPFFTTKAEGEGTGLGLATVYGIVTQNRGVIDVTSTPGQGTSFVVLLPRHASGGAVTDPAWEEKPKRHGSERILLVEDDAAVLQLAKRALEELGYAVLTARNGTDALRLVQSGIKPIHLLLTDVIMPGMNGAELARAVRAVMPEAAHVFMSGYPRGSARWAAVVDAEAHYLAKPFTPASLAAKVRDVLDREHQATE